MQLIICKLLPGVHPGKLTHPRLGVKAVANAFNKVWRLLLTCSGSLLRSRCTGYRPILDAFKVFAKVEPGAYTEEAIAASKAANGAQANGNAHHHSNGVGNASGDPQRGVDGMNPGIDKHKKGQKVRTVFRHILPVQCQCAFHAPPATCTPASYAHVLAHLHCIHAHVCTRNRLP